MALARNTFRTLVVGTVNMGLLAFCAFLAAVIIYNYPVRFDLSAESMNTLSDDTLTCLRSLDRPVEIIVSYGETDPGKLETTARIVRRLGDVLRQMTVASEKIRILEFIDVLRQGEEWLRLRERYQLAGYNRVTLICGGRRQDVRLEELAVIDWTGRGGTAAIRSFRAERSLTAALRRLQGKPRKLYFLTNLGTEGKVGRTLRDATPLGYRELAGELEANNYEVEELDLLKRGEVPRDCDVLMAAGLLGPLEEEVPILAEYLKRGGRFFFALNPLVNPHYLTFLADWGFEVEPAWTVMKIALAGTTRGTREVLATFPNPAHPITRKFEKGRFYLRLHLPRPLGAAKGRYGEREALVSTEGKNIWGERKIDVEPWSQDPNDFPSPVCVAGAAEVGLGGGATARIVVFGSASFLTNGDLRGFDHLSLLHNSLWWLVGEEELASVRAPEDVVRNVNFDVEGRIRRRLAWTFLGVVPGCAVLAGIAAFLIRRR